MVTMMHFGSLYAVVTAGGFRGRCVGVGACMRPISAISPQRFNYLGLNLGHNILL